MAFEKHLENHTERVQRGPDPDENQHDREDLAGIIERTYLAEAHRRDGRDSLVHRIEPGESQHDIADGSDDEHAREHRAAQGGAAASRTSPQTTKPPLSRRRCREAIERYGAWPGFAPP